MSDSKNETTKERLQILKESNDGFYISEQDLKLRGPGDMLGVRQSGDMGFAIADIYADASVLKLASDMSSELLLADPELANEGNKGIKEKLKEYMNNGFCRINL
jgi:ATP-dependent DNA helicase RecG